MRLKIYHKRKGFWRWPSRPLCNVAGDHWLMRCVKDWSRVTCKRCLRSRPERKAVQKTLKYYGHRSSMSTS